jgi:hypothetical protein
MFQQNHRTANGKTLLVAQMDDEHLLNIIGAIVSWAEQATSQFQIIAAQADEADRCKANGGAAMAEAQRKLYGLPEPPTMQEAITQYAQGMNQLAGKLEPYLLEAWTREFHIEGEEQFADLRDRWAAAVGRNRALSHPGCALLAPAISDDGAQDDLAF